MSLLTTYFTLSDWIGLSILAGLIVFGIIYFIVTWIINLYNRFFKKNCFNCKNWHLSNVASCGDGCEYRCLKRDDISTFNRYHRMISMNCHAFYTKCKQFDSKYNEEKDGSK